MKKTIMSLLILLSVGCNNASRFIDRKTNVFELRQMVQTKETNNYSSASMFFMIGHYSSGTLNILEVKVFAKVNGAYRFLDIPIEKIRIILVDSIKKPTIQFTYHDELRSDDNICDMNYLWKSCIITCSEEYLPERLLPIQIK